MAIENERKYILLPQNDLKFMMDMEFKGGNVFAITQAYLQGGARIRSKRNKFDTGYAYTDEKGEVVSVRPQMDLKFTYKHRVGDKLIEIETDISSDDYDALFSVSRNQIVKTRIEVDNNGEKWEIDFFYDTLNSNLYLIMAEIEMPDGQDAPNSLPDFISDNLLYAVPRDDRRFDNSNLSDPQGVRATILYLNKERELDEANLAYFMKGKDVDQSA
jgi:CYTH domain-containing protein